MKPYTLTNREGESISPMTSTRTVFDERGVDLDTLLEQQRQDADNALKDYAKKTEVTQSLAGKQNKLTPTTDLHITEDNIIGLTEAAKKRLFIDLWNEACGAYGKYDPANAPDPEHPFYLNELWLTYEEAVEVYNSFHKGANQTEALSKLPVRTNIPVRLQWNGDFTRYAQNNTTVEVLNLSAVLVGSTCAQAFYGCTNLRKVYGLSHLNGTLASMMFEKCSRLEYVGIARLKSNLDLRWSPRLSLESLIFLVENAANTEAITITVHPDVYAKLTGDTANPAAAELTEEELAQWQQLLVDAAEKQINFATT